MDQVSKSCDEFLVCDEKGELRFSNRHVPIALEQSSLECVPFPTVATPTSLCLSVISQNGQSVLSAEQKFAISLIRNAHVVGECFESEGVRGITASINDQPAEDSVDTMTCWSDRSDGFYELPYSIRTEVKRLGKTMNEAQPLETLRPAATLQKFRPGFWLADCHGFGNTRTIVGLIAEYCTLGTDKVVYFSSRWDSAKLLQKELRMLGLTNVRFDFLNASLSRKTVTRGSVLQILICSYRSLPTGCNEAIKNWIYDDNFKGLVILDDFHDGTDNATVLATVNNLLAIYPQCCVLFSSPLDSFDVKSYSALWRLGLYGKDLTFQTRNDFLLKLIKRGKFGQTQLWMELKMKGKMIARCLSFQNLNVNLVACNRYLEFDILYDCCVELWNGIGQYLHRLLEAMCLSSLLDAVKLKYLTELPAMFIRNRQEFFDELCVYAKLGEMEELLKSSLSRNVPVVVAVKEYKPNESRDVYMGVNRRFNAFDGIPYSNLMMLLRRTMTDLGIAVGYPKLYYVNSTFEYFDNSNKPKEASLVEFELGRSMAAPILGKIKKELGMLSSELSPCDCESHGKWEMKRWLPYSNGCHMNHPKLSSPERLVLRNVGNTKAHSGKCLAKHFHYLYPFLPLYLLDEIKRRSNACVQHLCPSSKVAEVAGRGIELSWDKETRLWTWKSLPDANKEYESFATGHAKVMLFNGTHPPNCERYKMPCCHILADFSLTWDDFTRVTGQTFNRGQQDSDQLYLLTCGLPVDLKLLRNLAKYFVDLGANVYCEERLEHTVCSKRRLDDIFTEWGLESILSVIPILNRRNVQFKTWYNMVLPRGIESTGLDELTWNSKLAVTKFLSQLRYLPVALQFNIMMEIDKYLFHTRVVKKGKSSFREIPRMYEPVVEKHRMLDLGGQRCDMYLFRLSRLNAVGNARELVENAGYRFYLDKENFPVCAASRSGLNMRLVSPFSMHPMEIPMTEWNARRVEFVPKTEGMFAWKRQLKRLQKKRHLCGHQRMNKRTPCPVSKQEKRRCLYQWGRCRFAILVGCFSSLLDTLEDYDLTLQHVKLTAALATGERPTCAGLYISPENFNQSALDLFNEIISIVS